MKTVNYLAVIALAVMCSASFISCGSDGESDGSAGNSSKNVENTSWNSVEFNEHSSSSALKDVTESSTVILSKMEQMSGLKYTEDETTETSEVSVNLCEKSGHTEDALMSMKFNSGKCMIKVTTLQSVEKAKKTITKKVYKFEEGSYIVNVGGSNYEGINVYSYGVYRANGTLFIPLDGNGCVAVETTTTFTDKQIVNINTEEKDIVADYSVSGNTISFSCTYNGQSTTFAGILSDDNQTISVSSNPFVSSIKTFKK